MCKLLNLKVDRIRASCNLRSDPLFSLLNVALEATIKWSWSVIKDYVSRISFRHLQKNSKRSLGRTTKHYFPNIWILLVKQMFDDLQVMFIHLATSQNIAWQVQYALKCFWKMSKTLICVCHSMSNVLWRGSVTVKNCMTEKFKLLCSNHNVWSFGQDLQSRIGPVFVLYWGF